MVVDPRLPPLLRESERIAVLTGAGISAESGIPTFRDAMAGLWAEYRPEELATRAGFRRDPALVWGWYRARRQAIAAALPNPGHRALAALETRCPGLTLITQNVDGLHQRAGSRAPVELHGNIGRVKCFDCDRVAAQFVDGDEVPRCDVCGGLLRPDVVWFGELLPRQALEAAHRAAEGCDLFLSVGTSNLVEPAASLPWIAAAAGATVLVVNTSFEGQRQGSTIIPVPGPAGAVLPALVNAAWPGEVR